MQGRLIGLAIAAVAAAMAPSPGLPRRQQPTCTNAAVTCVTGTAADGSTYKAEVPSPWNGTLLLYSHGYRPPIGPNPPADTWGNRAVADELLARGYALAGSSYAIERLGGGGARSAIRSICSTASSGRFGKPRRTIAWGESMGGMITAGLVERHPRRFDGALPFCGILGGAVGLWNQNLDLEYAIKTLLSADPNPAVSVPASQLELVHITDWQANVARANAAVAAAQATPEGRARLALAAALFNLPDWYEPGTQRPGPRRLRGAPAAGVPRAAVPARVHLRLPPGGRAARRRQPVVEHRRRLRPAARALRQPRRGQGAVPAEQRSICARPPAPARARAARARRPAGHPLPDPQRRLRRADPRAGADRAHDRGRARRLAARAGVPRHGPARRPRAAAEAAVASTGRGTAATPTRRRWQALDVLERAAGQRPLAAPSAGPTFVGYEPPPFLRPFDLAWPRSNGRQG